MLIITNFLIALSVLVLAVIIDLIFGDPQPPPWQSAFYNFHPTVWMGYVAKTLRLHLKDPNPQVEKINGIFLALVVILIFALPVYLGLGFLYVWLGFLVYGLLAAFVLKLAICVKLETDWARAAAKAIKSGDLEEARKFYHFSRRDSRDLTGSQIASAVIESMSENLIDFKLSPIFSYVLFGVSGAIAFRAINTLDGTVGFKDSENINIGWFSANLDTVVNYIPARLTAILIVLASALLGGDYKNAWAIARRDHDKTPSRNHGWPMAAMAGALGVELEKPGQYTVGDQIETLSSSKILEALKLRNMVIILCIFFSLPIIFLVRLFFFPY